METKLSQLINFMISEQWTKALSLANKFGQLGEHKTQIQQAHSAIMNPDFYRQIGKDPQQLLAEGIKALKERYAKPYQEAMKKPKA